MVALALYKLSLKKLPFPELSDYLIKFNFRRPSIFEAVTWGNPREEINPVTPVDDPGKQLRTNINRIRCVYRAN